MIEQIDKDYFERFDNSEGEDRIKEMDRLIIQYAHKFREIINQVNALTEEALWSKAK